MNPSKRAFVYNKRARIYENLMKFHRYESTLHGFIRSLNITLPSEIPNILDLGCGTGITTEVLKEKFPKALITGFDYSKEMLKIYEKKNPERELIQGDYNNELSFKTFPACESTSLDSSQYDLVVSSTSISECGLPSKIFPLVNRVLKSDGLFLIIGIKKNIIGYISWLIWGFKPLGKEALIKEFQGRGFTLIQEHKIPWKFFPMNLMKFAISARKN